MRKSTKLVSTAALAFAGLIAASGAAFTGTGVSTSGTAAADQFVGGTVSQAVTGATLTGITYGYLDAITKTDVNTITLAFAATADGHTVTAVPTGNVLGGTFTCGNTALSASTCTYTKGTDNLLGYLGLTSLAVTVS
jgi:hypothetical protein